LANGQHGATGELWRGLDCLQPTTRLDFDLRQSDHTADWRTQHPANDRSEFHTQFMSDKATAALSSATPRCPKSSVRFPLARVSAPAQLIALAQLQQETIALRRAATIAAKARICAPSLSPAT
jgi:hypothetical protein